MAPGNWKETACVAHSLFRNVFPELTECVYFPERRLEELTLCINQLMREKLKLASEDPNISFGDEDDGQFQVRRTQIQILIKCN